jgi:hypothetical protein|tara:strand:- start:93 stop:359 length:267 start_codon:yes stop_codon:yes gene_type:complete
LVHFEGPVGDGDDLSLKIDNVNFRVPGFEIINSFLGEVDRDVVVTVGNKEVWIGFLNEAFDSLGSLGRREFGEVSTVFEHGGDELFEG